jgi:hypothetical protein
MFKVFKRLKKAEEAEEAEEILRRIVGNLHHTRRQRDFWRKYTGCRADVDAEILTQGFGVEPQPEVWRKYAGDFNNFTDQEIESEVKISQDLIDEHEPWLEAVVSWKLAGKPRNVT